MTAGPSAGYLLVPLFVASAAVVLVALALYAGRQDRSRVPFLLLLSSLELWSIFTFLMRISPDTSSALVRDRLLAVAAISLFVTYFHFCAAYTGRRSRIVVGLAYGFLAAAAAVVLLTDLAILRIEPSPFGYAPVVGPAGAPLVAIGYLLVGSGMAMALTARGRAQAREERNRLLTVALAGIFPMIGAALDAFTNLPPMSIWANLAFSALCTIAVLKHRLLDIRVAARRGASHLLVSILLALPYAVAVTLLHAMLPAGVAWWVYAATILLVAVTLRLLYGWSQQLIDRLFYGQRYDSLLALRDFSREANSVAGLGQAGSRLTDLVRGALRASTATILQPTPDGRMFTATADRGGPGLRADGPVARWLRNNRTILSARMLAVDPVLQNLPAPELTALRSMDAQLLAPVFAKHGSLAGVIVLGPKAGGSRYTNDDLDLLEGVGTQAALALENNRLYADAEESRRTLEAWLQSVPDAVVTVDPRGLVRFANKAAHDRLDVRVGGGWPLEAGFRQQTILGRDYDIASAPLIDPQGTAGMICVLRDVTERKQHEEARAAWERRARITSHLASVGEMAAGIAHEINNPLTAVIGYTGLLAEMSLGGEAAELVASIIDGAKRVAAITQRLLTFARQNKPERRPVDVNEIIRSTVELRSYSLRNSNVQIRFDLDEQLPRTVADAQQIQQVILNLVINAESAMKAAHGGGVLTLRTRTANDRLLIAVADDGPGVPDELQERIFDPFFTTKGVGEGSGLGLSICHGIVSEHGGRISVRTPAGGGAEFTVGIPVVSVSERAASADLPRVAATAAQPGGRILVVDDEPAVRHLLERALEAGGHTVESVADGRAGYERILASQPDVVLLDIRMPGMSGVEVHERLSRESPHLARRIVFITGDVMAQETKEFVERTGARCVIKPFDIHSIAELVAEQLRTRA